MIKKCNKKINLNNMHIFNLLPLYSNYDYQKSKLARINPDENNGIGVSTTNTPDEGWETALLDRLGIHPVERYKNRTEAMVGHKKWVKFANNKKNTHVIKLSGISGLVPPEKIKLIRIK